MLVTQMFFTMTRYYDIPIFTETYVML